MKVKRAFFVLMVLVIAALPVQAADMPDIDGVYEQMPGHSFSFDGKQVEIVEFLNFYCGHCYNFEAMIPIIKGNFPKKIKWKTVPLYWGKSSKAIEAYFLAEEAGKGEAVKKAIFKAVFVDKRDISNVDVVERIGMDAGLGFDFSRKLRAGEKAKEVGEALIMAQAYKVESTPTLIIAGNLKVLSGATGQGSDALKNNVVTIVKSLFRE